MSPPIFQSAGFLNKVAFLAPTSCLDLLACRVVSGTNLDSVATCPQCHCPQMAGLCPQGGSHLSQKIRQRTRQREDLDAWLKRGCQLSEIWETWKNILHWFFYPLKKYDKSYHQRQSSLVRFKLQRQKIPNQNGGSQGSLWYESWQYWLLSPQSNPEQGTLPPVRSIGSLLGTWKTVFL